MPRVIDAFEQFLDGNGDPLVNGWLRFLVSGTNNTDKDTFADVSETIANTNPVQLDAEGRVPNVFGSGSYRIISYTNDPVLNIPAVQLQQFDPVGGDAGAGQLASWNNESIYTLSSYVIADDDNIYHSLINPNQGNDPETSPEAWEEVSFLGVYNVSRSYSIGDVVQTTNGNLWASQTNNNVANDPTTDDGTNWLPAVDDSKTASGIRTSTVIQLTGGGQVTALRINELQDGGAYTLPAANTVSAGEFLQVGVTDEYRTFEPTLAASGADTITYSGGSDTSFKFNAKTRFFINPTSDGVSNWSI